jgi:hypothetical protein
VGETAVKLVLVIAAIVAGLWILAALGIAIIVAFMPEKPDVARRESDSQ